MLVQLRPQVASRSITYLTLIAGFASTMFWPITTALHAQMSWQNVYLVFATINLLICLPIHAWLSHGAITRGYDATLVGDAHTTEDLSPYGAPPPDKVIAHTNLYWNYHTAPGRTAGTVNTADVDFGAGTNA